MCVCVCVCVCLSVSQRSSGWIVFIVCVSVLSWAYVDNHADAVDRLLMLILVWRHFHFALCYTENARLSKSCQNRCHENSFMVVIQKVVSIDNQKVVTRIKRHCHCDGTSNWKVESCIEARSLQLLGRNHTCQNNLLIPRILFDQRIPYLFQHQEKQSIYFDQ